MPHRAAKLIAFAALTAALALAACGRGEDKNSLANLDNQLVGNDSDPALTSALEDQILVDPTLANQSNKNAVRPPATPTQAQYPAPQPGAQPSGQAGSASAGGASAAGGGTRPPVRTASAESVGARPCGGGAAFDYNMSWASRLSPVFPVYPGGRVTDAAGRDEGNCRMRVVTFTTRDDWRRVLDWYNTQAVRAGYSSEHQIRGADHVLAGTNAGDGGAFYLIVTPAATGSQVALIANNGR